jgi:hypothetical protein
MGRSVGALMPSLPVSPCVRPVQKLREVFASLTHVFAETADSSGRDGSGSRML